MRAQKSVLADEEFKTKEQAFKVKVNKVQSKVQNIRRELESTMARGMQLIQTEAVKHLKEIASKEGYLVVFDAATTIITADIINISDQVTEKVNKSLPKINLERKKEKKLITNIIPKPQGPFSLQEISEETNCRIEKKILM